MCRRCSTLAFVICVCLAWATVSDGQGTNTTETRLRIVGFFPAHDSAIWPGGFYCIPGALLAAEQINSANLLPGYELDFEYMDSGGCDRQAAVVRYLKEIPSKTAPPVAIIGPGCSEAALALASFTAQPEQEALMVSYGASTPTLSNMVAFPYFLRTVHSQTFMGQSMASFVTHFKWKSIATVYEDGLIQRSTVLTFRASLSRLDGDIDLSSTHRLSIPNDHVTEQTEDLLARTLEQIKHRRIIFAFVHPAVGKRLMLQAARQNMVYPSYVWVFPQLYGQWWDLKCLENETNGTYSANNDTANNDTNLHCPKSNSSETNRECIVSSGSCKCRQELINRAVNGAFHFFYNLKQSPSIPWIESGLTMSQYKHNLTDRTRDFVAAYNQVNNVDVNINGTSAFASTAYDAVWAVALGLAFTEQKLQSVNLSLADHAENFGYISKVLHNSILNNVSFMGASGNISFNSHGTVESPVDVKQLQMKPGKGLHHVDIGVFHDMNIEIYNDSLYWNVCGESQPTDTFPPEYITLITANVGLLAGVLLLTVITLVANGSFIFVNYYFRNVKDVKATSPSLNNFIFSGHFCIIMYVVAFSIVSSVSHLEQVYYGILCNLLPWTLSVGYSLLNGTIFWKSWRLYTAFSARYKPSSQDSLKDQTLMWRIALVVLLCDVAPLILFTALTPLQKKVITENRDILEVTVSVCAFPDNVIHLVPLTISLIVVLKLLIVAFVTFSAVKMLRAKIQIELYNDSGPVFTFVLVQLLLIAVSFPLAPVFYGNADYKTRLSVMYSVLTIGPLLTANAGLAILFLPKYRKLPQALLEEKQKPRNVHVADRSSFSLQQSNSESNSSAPPAYQRYSWPSLSKPRRSQQVHMHSSHSSASIPSSPATSSSFLRSYASFSSDT